MRFALLLAFVGSITACGPKSANQCPGNLTGHCVAGEECSMDRKRGCQICQCKPLDKGDSPDPLGHTNPDDQNQPPIPVH